MSGDGPPPATGPDLRERVRQARQSDQARLEAQAEAAMQNVAAAMTRTSEQLLDAWTRWLRGSLTATARDAEQETARTAQAVGTAARQEIAATTQDATQQIAGTATAATAQIEDAARRAVANLNRLDRETERIGIASRRLARWPLILAVLAAVGIVAAALWARVAILPDTTTVARPDGTMVTVLDDPRWAPCPEGLCKTEAATTTGG